MADERSQRMLKFETPWTIRQTETHLVFGPLSRRLPFAYVLAPVAAMMAYFLWRSRQFGIAQAALLVLAVAYVFRLTVRQQAIFGWLITKTLIGVLAVMAVILIFPMTLSEHQADAWPILLLGLIWFPLLGAFPKLTPRQKYFTLARVLVSIPVGFWFYRSATFT